MSIQNSYYKLIRARLEKLSTTTAESIQSVDQPTSYNDNNLSTTSESISNLYVIFFYLIYFILNYLFPFTLIIFVFLHYHIFFIYIFFIAHINEDKLNLLFSYII